jgi:hypothetical protein
VPEADIAPPHSFISLARPNKGGGACGSRMFAYAASAAMLWRLSR